MDSETLEATCERLNQIIQEGFLDDLAVSFVGGVILYLLFELVVFLLGAVGLYTLNKRLNAPLPLLSFIPGLSGHAFGAVGDSLKTRKQSSYRVHLMMLSTFYLLSFAVYAWKMGEGFIELYQMLQDGSVTVTPELFKSFSAELSSDLVLVIANYAMRITNFLVLAFGFFCLSRILRMVRSRHPFWILLLFLLFPESLSIYFFVIRKKPLITDPSHFFGESGTTGSTADRDSPEDGSSDGDSSD